MEALQGVPDAHVQEIETVQAIFMVRICFLFSDAVATFYARPGIGPPFSLHSTSFLSHWCLFAP